jgi:hypothetical protein
VEFSYEERVMSQRIVSVVAGLALLVGTAGVVEAGGGKAMGVGSGEARPEGQSGGHHGQGAILPFW